MKQYLNRKDKELTLYVRENTPLVQKIAKHYENKRYTVTTDVTRANFEGNRLYYVNPIRPNDDNYEMKEIWCCDYKVGTFPPYAGFNRFYR